MAGEETPDVTARDPNIEDDVRAIVARIVDGLLEGEGPEQPPAPSGPETVSGLASAPPPLGTPASPDASQRVVAIGGDHGGYALKERLGHRLLEAGYEVIDCGTDSTEAVDYPDIAVAVSRAVADGRASAGIIVDGAGIGSAMAANKVPGIRAALCHDLSTARNAREHNHANVLTLGAGLTGDALAWQITEEFLATAWGPGRHARRVALIDALDAVRAGVS
jgi:ribose 5-phosphate isomerase B